MSDTLLDTSSPALPACRESDGVVAEKVLGWQWWASRSWHLPSEDATEKVPGPWRRFLAPPGWHPSDNCVGDWERFYREADGTEETYADWYAGTETLLPHYTTRNGPALDMAEAIGLLSGRTTLVLYQQGQQWCVAPVASDNGLCEPLVQADTPALALCRAALSLKEKR